MARIKRLTAIGADKSERILWLNVDEVTYMEVTDEGLRINTTDGRHVSVTTTPVEVQILADQIVAFGAQGTDKG